MSQNEMLMKFINHLFPEGFSNTEEGYGVIYFKNNVGKGSKRIKLQQKMDIEIIEYAKLLDANEVILVHAQPNIDINTYPTTDDIQMFNIIEKQLTLNNISIYNNALIYRSNNEWKCTSFKDVGQSGNFK